MQKNKIQSCLLTLIFGLTAYCFFYKLYPYHLHYQEQFQLFLFTKTYFSETALFPGGFSNYAGRFLTQFFVHSWLGALIISLMLAGVQLSFAAILKKISGSRVGETLSFLPSIFYWYLLCDENSQTGGLVALLLSLIFALTIISIKPKTLRLISFLLTIPLLYSLAGGVVCLSVILVLLHEYLKNRPSIKKLITVSFTALLISLASPFVSKYFLQQYPLYRYFWGVDYVHFSSYSPRIILYLWGMIILFAASLKYLPAVKKINIWLSFSIKLAFIMLASYLFIIKIAYTSNLSKEEIMAYDYHCRIKDWNGIIGRADKKSPTVPMTVACLNLALYKTGQLPDRMFHYFQNGPEGLLPSFQRDFMISMVAGEPYYYLGFVNVAQRFAFEAMEALPDYQKSVRSIQRLAETNLIRGHYPTAEKYIYILEHTLFYKKWATDARTFLYNEDKIKSHPEWGEIRRFQTEEDFVFSEKEKDMMLGLYFEQHKDNRIAFEYLMAHTLLTKDIKNFPAYFQLNKDFSSPNIPLSYQEALVYIWGLNNESFTSIPFAVSDRIKQDVKAYANIYTTVQSPEAALRQKFSKTYWYYLHFRQYRKIDSDISYQY